VKNESGKARTIAFEMEVFDLDGTSLDKVRTSYLTISQGETVTLRVDGEFHNLHFWSWKYGYLYDVKTRIIEAGKIVDEVNTRTGFRKTEFAHGQIFLNITVR